MTNVITGRESLAQITAVADLLKIPALEITESGTNRNASQDDVGKVIYFTNASTKTYTFLAESALSEPPLRNQVFTVCNDGAGLLTLTFTGTTSETANAGVTVAQHAYACIIYRGNNVYKVCGNTA